MSLKSTCLLKAFVPLSIVFAINSASAQLNNSGGTIKISNGASIICTGSVNNNSGTITNDGKLEVRGSFTNAGTYNSTSNEDSLLLTDTGAVTLNTGSASLNYLTINKVGGGGVTLTGNTTVNTKLDFLAGTFSTNPLTTYELAAPVTATFSFAAGTEISGKVRRSGWVNETPVIFNQPNMQLTTHGGTAPTGMSVNMVANGDPSAAEREVKRSFYFTPVGGTGYTADVTFPYKSTELNNNVENNLVPWYYSASEWNARMTGNTLNAPSDYITSTGIDAATFSGAEWKLADPNYTFNVNTYLKGPWNGTTMSTALNTAGLLPLAQPYNTAPFNYTGTESVASIPNSNIVDWVLLELRKPSSGLAADATSATLIGRKAAFLTSSGTIVDLDGATPASFNISKQGTSFVVVRHRNHLAVMSNAVPSNAVGTFANNFGTLANVYKNPSASSDPETVLAGSTYGLWAGDANKSASVNAIDLNAVRSAISNLLSGYQLQDVNLNGNINALDLNVSRATISLLGTGSAAARAVNQQTATLTTHVPE